MIAPRKAPVVWKPGQGFGTFEPSTVKDAQRELIDAAANGDLTRLTMVLDNPAISIDASCEDESGRPEGQPALHVASRGGYRDAVALLIKHGANVNMQADFNNTALHLACYNGHSDVVEDLLCAGADTELQNNAGWTPIFWPCTNMNATILVKLLLAGADVNATTPEGWTPLHKACENGLTVIVHALLRAGADEGTRTIHGQTPLDVGLNRKRTDLIPIFERARNKRSKAEIQEAAAHKQGTAGFLLRSLRQTGRCALKATTKHLWQDPAIQHRTKQPCKPSVQKALLDAAEAVGKRAAKEGRSSGTSSSK